MTAAANKAPRAPKSLDDEIARAAAKLKKLQDQKRAAERQALERNERAIFELLKADKLNEVPVEKWKAAIVTIRRTLGVAVPIPSSGSDTPVATPSDSGVTA